MRPPGPANKVNIRRDIGTVDPNEQEEVRSHLRVLFTQLPSETLRKTLEGRLRGVISSVATKGSSKLAVIFSAPAPLTVATYGGLVIPRFDPVLIMTDGFSWCIISGPKACCT
jgi:hypothetical protein